MRLARILGFVGGVLGVLLLIGGVVAYQKIAPALGWVDPVVDTVPPKLPSGLDSASVAILDFSKTSGFRHEDAIPAAARSLADIAERNGWVVFRTENAAVFDEALLSSFDVVFGNNITGANWSEPQKQAFIRWIEGGGAFVGVHGAAGTRFRYWNWYTDELLGGGRFIGHPVRPQFQEATVRIEQPAHPIVAHLGDAFVHLDEWYSFEKSPRAYGSHVLASLDESTYEPGEGLEMGEDHPIIWIACPGQGRSFYSALGHGAETYARPDHEKMLEEAIRWAADPASSCP